MLNGTNKVLGMFIVETTAPNTISIIVVEDRFVVDDRKGLVPGP